MAEYSIGSCKVYFTPNTTSATEVNLGYTSGGVNFRSEPESQEIMVDQLKVPLDEVLTKNAITVTCPFARIDLDNFKLAFPGSKIITDATDTTKKKLVIPAEITGSLKDYAGQLRLYPCDLEDTDKSLDVLLPLAAPTGQGFDMGYTREELKTIPVTFKAFAPTTGTNAGMAVIIGDPTATPAP